MSYTREKLDTHPGTTIPAAQDNQKPRCETTHRVIAVTFNLDKASKNRTASFLSKFVLHIIKGMM